MKLSFTEDMSFGRLKQLCPEQQGEKRRSVLRLRAEKALLYECISGDMRFSVYEGGHAVYSAGGRSVVVPLHNVRSYLYYFVSDTDREGTGANIAAVPLAELDRTDWRVVVCLVGESVIGKRRSEMSAAHELQLPEDPDEERYLTELTVPDHAEMINERDEQAKRLERAFASMTALQREVITRHFINERSYADIAAELGISARSAARAARTGIMAARRGRARKIVRVRPAKRYCEQLNAHNCALYTDKIAKNA